VTDVTRAPGRPSILDLLDLEYVEDNLYRSRTVYDSGGRMYGGQAAAQALYAAGLTVDSGRLPHSMHAYFLRQGDTSRPALFQVERDRDGRSFAARRVTVVQDGRVIFSMSASFTHPAETSRPTLDEEAEPVPELPPVESLAPWTGHRHPSFDFRVADPGLRLPNRFWIKCAVELPEDPLLHAAVLAYTSDISSALIPYETDGRMTGPSLDHAVWFHRPARMDGWTWQELVPRTVAAGRGWYTATIYAEDGTRIATAAQEQLIRPGRAGSPGQTR
jgi:acyl-CoA thioesterase-2